MDFINTPVIIPHAFHVIKHVGFWLVLHTIRTRTKICAIISSHCIAAHERVKKKYAVGWGWGNDNVFILFVIGCCFVLFVFLSFFCLFFFICSHQRILKRAMRASLEKQLDPMDKGSQVVHFPLQGGEVRTIISRKPIPTCDF